MSNQQDRPDRVYRVYRAFAAGALTGVMAMILVASLWLIVLMSRGIVHMIVDIMEAWPW